MTAHDDYRHEVDRLNTEQVEAILAGRDPGGPAAGRALAVLGEIREVLLKELPAGLADRHLAAVAAARRGRPARTDRRSSTSRRRRLVVALAAALAVGAGAATALTLRDRPDQARRPVPDDVRPSGIADTGPSVGVPILGDDPLPETNAREGTRSNHGQEVSDFARGTNLQGCDKGQAVSDRASEKAQGKRLHRANNEGPCDRLERPKGDRHGSGSRARGGEDSAPGQRRAMQPRGGGPPSNPGPPPRVDPGPPEPRAVVP